ncbi:MAG: 50S ribosomal protein L24 [Candidatus Parcubacteria bacterium]|nr:50S ribosomal protein L24 [Candidatus Parcubacteria bacterium]
MKIKKGDQVIILSGKDKGKKSKVIQAFPKEGRILVEGVNLKKKRVRPKKNGEKGQIVQITASIDISNAQIICSKCAKPARVGYKIIENKKYRICKKCGETI